MTPDVRGCTAAAWCSRAMLFPAVLCAPFVADLDRHRHFNGFILDNELFHGTGNYKLSLYHVYTEQQRRTAACVSVRVTARC